MPSESADGNMNTSRSLLKSIRLGFIIVAVTIVFAYGFRVTDVNFVETREEQRLVSLYRILRALAHPNVVEYDKEELIIETPIYLPCPENGVPAINPDTSNPYLVVTPACGEAREFLKVEGYNFWPSARGPIFFIPPSLASFQIGNFSINEDGYFSTTIQLPNRQPVEEAQILRAIARRNIGSPHFTSMAESSWDKIIETVFLAFLAAAFGTMLAIPISFLAARNLMAQVKAPLTGTALSILSWPIGIFFGIKALSWVGSISAPIADNSLYLITGLVISLVVSLAAIRWGLPSEEAEGRNTVNKIASAAAFIISGLAGIFFLHFLAYLAIKTGKSLDKEYELLSFVGNFIFQLGDMLQILIPVIVALVAGGAMGSVGGQIGQRISDKMKSWQVKNINLLVAPLSGAVLLALLGAGIDWFYQFEDAAITLYWPAAVGAGIGIFLALVLVPKRALPVGIVVYYITRGILNTIRSIEPLIMVIVAVVWVGIGPFAGALALGLHTVAALAKLFSEQVENIMPGPLEAVQATGANRLQTIIYAVVPQIIPPYISFTMYRWDINVRMSTIIGFAGGGGIGFLLQQNIRLFAYRDASVQMLAIVIVVASMDYISSTLRERYV